MDGIRAFYFFGIFLMHYDVKKYWYAGYGLFFFFVLSGFIITYSIQLDEDGNFFSEVYRFYVRRFLRLMPIYYLMIAVLFALGGLTFSWGWYATYLFNIKLFATTLSASFTYPTASSFMPKDWYLTGFHFWTVCLEEQFYLVYPVIFFITPAARRIKLVTGLIIFTIFTRIYCAVNYPSSMYGIILPVLGELVAWGCLAYLVSSLEQVRRISSGLLMFGGLLLFGFILFVIGPPRDTIATAAAHQPTFRLSLMGIGIAAFTIGLWNDKGSLLSKFLSFRPFVFLGNICFGLYLIHPVMFSAFNEGMLRWPAYFSKISPIFGPFAMTIGAASVSWYLLERPIYNLKSHFLKKTI